MSFVRICHMTSAHDSNDIRIFHKECSSLAKNSEYEVYLVAKGKDRKENNVNVIGVNQQGMGRIKRMLFFSYKIYRQALKLNADIYHFHDPELLPYAYLLKLKGKCVVFDSHEDTCQQILIKEYIPFFLRKIIGKIYFIIESFICRRIDAVIFPCMIEKKHPFDGRSKKSIYINNYPIIKEKADTKVVATSMCYVGSLTEKRGVTTLLEAYDLFGREIPLILAGQFESEEYERTLKDRGLLENVDYRGYCTQSEVEEIYMESQIGISNLHNVGQYPKLGTFPTKVYEYMANGLAVIVSGYPYSEEVLNNNLLGVTVNPESATSIYGAMRYLSQNKELVKQMGANGTNLVRDEYNWEIEYKKLEALYEELMR